MWAKASTFVLPAANIRPGPWGALLQLKLAGGQTSSSPGFLSCLSRACLWGLGLPGSPYPPLPNMHLPWTTNEQKEQRRQQSNVDLSHKDRLPWLLCDTKQGSAPLWALIFPFLKPHPAQNSNNHRCTVCYRASVLRQALSITSSTYYHCAL